MHEGDYSTATTSAYSTTDNLIERRRQELLIESDKSIKKTNYILEQCKIFISIIKSQMDFVEDLIDIIKDHSYGSLDVLTNKLRKHEIELTELLSHFARYQSTPTPEEQITSDKPNEKEELIEKAQGNLNSASSVLFKTDETLISVNKELQFVEDLRDLLENSNVNSTDLELMENKISSHLSTLNILLSNFNF